MRLAAVTWRDLEALEASNVKMPSILPSTSQHFYRWYSNHNGNGRHTTYKNGDDWGLVNMTLFYQPVMVFFAPNWQILAGK